MPATQTALLARMLLRSVIVTVDGAPVVCSLDADFPALARAGLAAEVGDRLIKSFPVLTAKGIAATGLGALGPHLTIVT